MPSYPPNNEHWLGNKLSDLTRSTKGLQSGYTQYVIDPATLVCEAIIGNVTYDQNGNSTGLSGWGIATWNGSAWSKL